MAGPRSGSYPPKESRTANKYPVGKLNSSFTLGNQGLKSPNSDPAHYKRSQPDPRQQGLIPVMKILESIHSHPKKASPSSRLQEITITPLCLTDFLDINQPVKIA